MNKISGNNCHPTSGEELSCYIAEQYQLLQNEPELYQWKINYQHSYAWPISFVASIPPVCFGLYGPLNIDGWAFFNYVSNSMYIMAVLAVLYVRYLDNANVNYHYHITAKGIYYTEQDDIPEVAFTIIRGVGWLGCVVCVLVAADLGPGAFVGAGGSALLAWQLKNMRPELKEQVCLYSKGNRALLTLFEKEGLIELDGLESSAEHARLYCSKEEYHKVLKLIYPYLDNYQVHEVDNWKDYGK